MAVIGSLRCSCTAGAKELPKVGPHLHDDKHKEMNESTTTLTDKCLCNIAEPVLQSCIQVCLACPMLV
jgi:hypothetical protein